MKKTPPHFFAGDAVEWVRRVNRRWIVHKKLNDTTEAFLSHLENTDPARLERGCRFVREVIQEGRETEDPKALFYSALFSIATPAEARRFLAKHLFTKLAWQAGREGELPEVGLSEVTRRKLEQIRRQIAGNC